MIEVYTMSSRPQRPWPRGYPRLATDHLRISHPDLYAPVVQLYVVLAGSGLIACPSVRDDFHNLVNSIEATCCRSGPKHNR